MSNAAVTDEQTLYLVKLWNGSRWERESDETFFDVVAACNRMAELVRAGHSLDDVKVEETTEALARDVGIAS